MDLIIESDGEQYNVIIDLDDYLDDPKTIMKQIRLTVAHIIKESTE